MNTNQSETLHHDTPIREFRDVHMYAQLAMGVVGALGLFATISLFTSGLLPFAAGALVATAVALGVVYLLLCRPARLSQTSGGLTIQRGNQAREISFDQLSDFSASWTDIHRNGVYQNTLVRFEFGQYESAKRWRYNSFAMYDTLKYKDLQAFQADVADVLAQRLLAELQENGRVEWTNRLTLLPDGIEFKKNANADARHITYSRVTQCELDQGLLKLAIDGSQKPNIVEKTNQTNFYPGLMVFEQLMGQATPKTAFHDGVHTAVV